MRKINLIFGKNLIQSFRVLLNAKFLMKYHQTFKKIKKNFFAMVQSERSQSGAVSKSDGAGVESE
jgi:hypothetical protein